jgi:hypothetical protein
MFFKRKNKKRQSMRMTTRTTGTLIIDQDRFNFTTHDLSLDGASLHISEECKPKKGRQVELLLDDMEVSGTATLCWTKSAAEGGTLIGIQFDNLEGHEEDARYKNYVKEQQAE